MASSQTVHVGNYQTIQSYIHIYNIDRTLRALLLLLFLCFIRVENIEKARFIVLRA